MEFKEREERRAVLDLKDPVVCLDLSADLDQEDTEAPLDLWDPQE